MSELTSLLGAIEKVNTRNHAILWVDAGVIACFLTLIGYYFGFDPKVSPDLALFFSALFFFAIVGLGAYTMSILAADPPAEKKVAPSDFPWVARKPKPPEGAGLVNVTPAPDADTLVVLFLEVRDYKTATFALKKLLTGRKLTGCRLALGLYGEHDIALDFLGTKVQWKALCVALCDEWGTQLPDDLSMLPHPFRALPAVSETATVRIRGSSAARLNKLYGNATQWSGGRIGPTEPVAFPGPGESYGIYAYIAVTAVGKAHTQKEFDELYSILHAPKQLNDKNQGTFRDDDVDFYSKMLVEIFTDGTTLIWLKVIVPRDAYYRLADFTSKLDQILSSTHLYEKFNIITTLGAEVFHVE